MEINKNDLFSILRKTVMLQPMPPGFLAELEQQANGMLRTTTFSGLTVMEFVLKAVQENRNERENNIRMTFAKWLRYQDEVVNPSWDSESGPNSVARREKLMSLMSMSRESRSVINQEIPPYISRDIVIALEQPHWYSETRQKKCAFYGPSIIRYLTSRGGIPEESIRSVNTATDRVVGFLADPLRVETFQARGLVVGYVQSGKTTNINVLIGKAIDVGYRLIIVLAGLTDVLRVQTQRRIDKEVVGKGLLDDDPDENEDGGYSGDKDWSDFIEHERINHEIDPPKIERNTTKNFDFNRGRGAQVFTNDWVDNGKSVRIVVIKKNATRLVKLRKEIGKIQQKSRNKLSVLVIDDESDQASVNTRRFGSVNASGGRDRTATNQEIVGLLQLLPRSQYVGFTATPFANVFIDPDDPEDLFPKHFVYALAEPLGYMGLKAFHDLDEEYFPVIEIDNKSSNKWKHVRTIDRSSPNQLESSLREAIDAFVLAGALKLFRMDKGVAQFRHHTFFYSDSTSRDSHHNAEVNIKNLWSNSGYSSPGGINRLEQLYESDIRGRSDNSQDVSQFPKSFHKLRVWIDKAIQKINCPFVGKAPVLVVNSDNQDSSPDFAKEDIWKIIVGGAKLSRGYTIEGLTTTYFRRSTKAQATLLQMGRWFGYRQGYRDLVRLYISGNELLGKKETIDLYKAFEVTCRDEEAFRAELRRYELPLANGKMLQPAEIPPLVQASHPQLSPDQPAKMWNAELQSRNFGGEYFAPYSATNQIDKLRLNCKLFTDLFSQFPLKEGDLSGKIKMHFATIPHEHVERVIQSFVRHEISRKDNYFRDFLRNKQNEIKDWVIILPIVRGSNANDWVISHRIKYCAVERSWDEKIMAFTTTGEDRHRIACYQIAGIKDSTSGATSKLVSELYKPSGRAVLLLYPMRDSDGKFATPETPALGMEFFLPKNKLPRAKFGPKDQSRRNALTIIAQKI